MENFIDIEDLKTLIGKELKYKEICSILGLKYYSNGCGSKGLQIKKLSKLCELEKLPKARFRINKVYDNADVFNKKYSFDYNNKGFNVPQILKYNSGIYKIYYKNNIYIGQTNNFNRRFSQHFSNTTDDYCREGHGILQMGGVFEIIELQDDKQVRLEREQKYIDLYKSLGYNVFNKLGNTYNSPNKQKYFKLKINEKDKNNIIQLLKENNIKYEVIK